MFEYISVVHCGASRPALPCFQKMDVRGRCLLLHFPGTDISLLEIAPSFYTYYKDKCLRWSRTRPLWVNSTGKRGPSGAFAPTAGLYLRHLAGAVGEYLDSLRKEADSDMDIVRLLFKERRLGEASEVLSGMLLTTDVAMLRFYIKYRQHMQPYNCLIEPRLDKRCISLNTAEENKIYSDIIRIAASIDDTTAIIFILQALPLFPNNRLMCIPKI